MNEYDLLIQNIRQLVAITEEEAHLIRLAFKPKMLKKKEILLHTGEVSVHMRFIARGCLRSYYLDTQAQEHILQFGIENWWINDLYSFLTQTPARHFVQALEPSL